MVQSLFLVSLEPSHLPGDWFRKKCTGAERLCSCALLCPHATNILGDVSGEVIKVLVSNCSLITLLVCPQITG